MEPEPVSGERESLEQWLDYERETLFKKCAGLSAQQLKLLAVPPSALSLLGLVRHMTDVERWWFRMNGADEAIELLYTREGKENADFDELDQADAEADLARLRTEIEAARAAVRDKALDFRVAGRGHHDWRPDIRWIFVHMIEEYARHNGHADLLRERIDGTVGD